VRSVLAGRACLAAVAHAARAARIVRVTFLAVLTLALAPGASACAAPPDDDGGVEIRLFEGSGRFRPSIGAVAVGGEIELAVSEPDPENPRYLRPATIAGHHVQPATSVLVMTHPGRRNLVVTALAEGRIELTVTTASGREGRITLSFERPARLELDPFAAEGNATVPLPRELLEHTFRLDPHGDAALALEVHAFGADGRELLGDHLVEWESWPPAAVVLEPSLGGRGRRVRVRPAGGTTAGGEGREITVRARPRASVAAAAVVEQILSIATDAAGADGEATSGAAELRAYPVSTSPLHTGAPLSVVDGRAALDLVAGTSRAVAVFALGTRGEVLLGGEPLGITLDPGDAGLAATLLFFPNVVFVRAEREGRGRVDVAHDGKVLSLDVRVAPPPSPQPPRR
jgi:hypothetical protein